MSPTACLLWAALMAAGTDPRLIASTAEDRRVQAIEQGLAPYDPRPGAEGSVSRETFTLAQRMAEYKIPGVGIAVVDDGRIAWAKGYGTRMAGQDAPVLPDTLFEAASTTKALTAVTALHFVDKGRLSLDEDVNLTLKSWKVPYHQGTSGQRVTLRRLLTHQSGLQGPSGGFSWDDGTAPTLVQVLAGQPPARNQAVVFGGIPGAEWTYSNFNYVLVQLLLEDLTGKAFPQVVEEVVFRPLGMDSSTFAYPLAPVWVRREALPHDPEGATREARLHPTAVAQGGLVTTPSDLARLALELMDAYQGRPSRVLSQRTARMMFQKGVDLDPALLGFPMGEGLGVFVRGAEPDLSFLHPGDNYPGASCWLVGFPARGKGAVIMTNGAKGNLLAMELLTAIGREYGWPAPPGEGSSPGA